MQNAHNRNTLHTQLPLQPQPVPYTARTNHGFNKSFAKAANAVATAGLALGLAATAHAQSGDRAGPSATDLLPEAGWSTINTEAWDSFRSGDSERMFGLMADQHFALKFEYMSEATLWGYRIAHSTFKPSFEWVGPLFGGESYTEVIGLLPTDNRFADQLWIYGGWRYHLTQMLDIDIGGTFVFADQRLAGPGLPSQDGWRARGTIYFGFIGRHWIKPSYYTIYDFELDQTQFVLSLKPELPLTRLGLPLEGFFVEGLASIAYLQGNRWTGAYGYDQGASWHNDYAYWEVGARLKYRFSGKLEGITTYIGILYSGNDDGPSDRSYPGSLSETTGPRQQLSFQTGISYAF